MTTNVLAYSDEWDHILSARSFEEQKKFNAAVAEYEKAIIENPTLVFLYKILGDLYKTKLNNYNKAIETYQKGLEIDKKDFSLNLKIMYSYFDQHDILNGINHYKILSKIRSKKDKFSFSIESVNLITRGMNDDEKIKFCKEYLSLNSKDTILREFLVNLYKKRKEHQKIKNEIETLLEYEVSQGHYYYDLSIANFSLGNFEESFNALVMAQKLGEDIPKEYFEMVENKLEGANK